MSEFAVYQDFAEFYDLLMQDAPYEQWVFFFDDTMNRINGKNQPGNDTIPRLSLADLGCGTGTLSVKFFEKGHKVIGVDLSEEMLAQAQAKLEHPTPFLRFLQQDVRSLHLPEKVDGAVSFCDSFNYLLEEADLLQAFRAVRSQIKPQGFFLFDMHSPYKLREKLGENTFYEIDEEVAYIWQSHFDSKRCQVQYDVTFFALAEEDLYRRFNETHEQRAYPRETIQRLLGEAGFSEVECGADFAWAEPTDSSERYFFLAR